MPAALAIAPSPGMITVKTTSAPITTATEDTFGQVLQSVQDTTPGPASARAHVSDGQAAVASNSLDRRTPIPVEVAVDQAVATAAAADILPGARVTDPTKKASRLQAVNPEPVRPGQSRSGKNTNHTAVSQDPTVMTTQPDLFGTNADEPAVAQPTPPTPAQPLDVEPATLQTGVPQEMAVPVMQTSSANVSHDAIPQATGDAATNLASLGPVDNTGPVGIAGTVPLPPVDPAAASRHPVSVDARAIPQTTSGLTTNPDSVGRKNNPGTAQPARATVTPNPTSFDVRDSGVTVLKTPAQMPAGTADPVAENNRSKVLETTAPETTAPATTAQVTASPTISAADTNPVVTPQQASFRTNASVSPSGRDNPNTVSQTIATAFTSQTNVAGGDNSAAVAQKTATARQPSVAGEASRRIAQPATAAVTTHLPLLDSNDQLSTVPAASTPQPGSSGNQATIPPLTGIIGAQSGPDGNQPAIPQSVIPNRPASAATTTPPPVGLARFATAQDGNISTVSGATVAMPVVTDPIEDVALTQASRQAEPVLTKDNPAQNATPAIVDFAPSAVPVTATASSPEPTPPAQTTTVAQPAAFAPEPLQVAAQAMLKSTAITGITGSAQTRSAAAARPTAAARDQATPAKPAADVPSQPAPPVASITAQAPTSPASPSTRLAATAAPIDSPSLPPRASSQTIGSDQKTMSDSASAGTDLAQIGATSDALLEQATLSATPAAVPTVSSATAALSAHSTNTASPLPQIAPALLTLAKANDGSQQITVRLQPAELGMVQIKIARAASGATQIDVTADNPTTLLALQRDQPQLHRTLDEAGIAAAGRTVTFHAAQAAQTGTGGNGSGSSGSHANNQQTAAGKSNTGTTDADGSTGGGRGSYPTTRERSSYSTSRRPTPTQTAAAAATATGGKSYRIGLDITA